MGNSGTVNIGDGTGGKFTKHCAGITLRPAHHSSQAEVQDLIVLYLGRGLPGRPPF
jgi:hypothetical protein